jgi:hypothetical protein
MNGLVKRADYCQFLMVSQVNYTATYFAAHGKGFSHDAATRYLGRDCIRPSSAWEKAKGDIVVSFQGYLVFDDPVVDKNHPREMELVYRQYSGNEHRVIRGIGLISCVYVNPELEPFWVIDYRLYDPDTEGKDKHQHVAEMYNACFERFLEGELEFQAVLMDTWYATTKLMVKIHRSGLRFYCPIKPNRAVSEVKTDQKYKYQQAETLEWTDQELEVGKQVHLPEFPQGLEVKLFRIAVSTDSTELIVTHDDSPSLTAEAVREAQGLRWSDHARPVRLMVKKGGAVSQRTQRRNWRGCLSMS